MTDKRILELALAGAMRSWQESRELRDKYPDCEEVRSWERRKAQEYREISELLHQMMDEEKVAD